MRSHATHRARTLAKYDFSALFFILNLISFYYYYFVLRALSLETLSFFFQLMCILGGVVPPTDDFYLHVMQFVHQVEACQFAPLSLSLGLYNLAFESAMFSAPRPVLHQWAQRFAEASLAICSVCHCLFSFTIYWL